eukprot:Clim_evm41s150 gene=Clim_evmTU41s150
MIGGLTIATRRTGVLGLRYLHTSRVMQQKLDLKMVQKLKKTTGLGLDKCKKAVEAAENDWDRAIQWVRDNAKTLGMTKAAKLDGRAADQGLIAAFVNKDSGAGVLVEVNSETDFVAKNERFQEFVSELGQTILGSGTVQSGTNEVGTLDIEGEIVKSLRMNNGKIVNDQFLELVGIIGENLQVGRTTGVFGPPGIVYGVYVHNPVDSAATMGQMAGIVGLSVASSKQDAPEVVDLARKLAQQVVGLKPMVLHKEDAKAKTEAGTPVSGEDIFLEQEYLFDPSKTVAAIVEEQSKHLGTEIVVKNFAHLAVGQ